MNMAEQDTLSPKKFFFDEHIFDEDHEEGNEGESEPAPIFSEEELNDAKKQAYDKGYDQAKEDAENARERFVSELLERIAADTAGLFDAEHERNRLYEKEAVNLALSIFAKLYPEMGKTFGTEEIKALINKVFATGENPPEIKISVHPDYVDDIKTHIDTIAPHEKPATINVFGDPDMTISDCDLSWDDGGALRDAGSLAEQIRTYLEEMLAEKLSVHDNKTKSEDNQQPDTDIAEDRNEPTNDKTDGDSHDDG